MTKRTRVLEVYRGKKIGVAVPAYNEEKYIARTLEEMPEYVDKFTLSTTALRLELLKLLRNT